MKIKRANDTGKVFGYCMLGTYVLLTITCIAFSDHEHAFMFGSGSGLWIAGIYVWEKTKE